MRLLATPIVAQGRSLVVVVGASVEAREEALGNLVENALRHGEGTIVLTAAEVDGRDWIAIPVARGGAS